MPSRLVSVIMWIESLPNDKNKKLIDSFLDHERTYGVR